jgi:hypothetical protein
MNAGARAEVAEALAVFGDAYAALGDRRNASLAYRESATIYREVHARGQLAAVGVREMERVAALAKATI